MMREGGVLKVAKTVTYFLNRDHSLPIYIKNNAKEKLF
jgi:hypothetical protein